MKGKNQHPMMPLGLIYTSQCSKWLGQQLIDRSVSKAKDRVT